jgi:hypothetical protein
MSRPRPEAYVFTVREVIRLLCEEVTKRNGDSVRPDKLHFNIHRETYENDKLQDGDRLLELKVRSWHEEST